MIFILGRCQFLSYILQKRISQIFIEQVSKRGFNHVSVASLMKKGNVRRQTFYDNFKDKYDLLEWTIRSMMEDDIISNLDYLSWEEIIPLVFYDIEINAKFFRSVIADQTEVDVVKEISLYMTTLLLHILETKGLVKNDQARDFVETYSLGMTYTMTNNLYKPHPKEYDELSKKVVNAIYFTFKYY